MLPLGHAALAYLCSVGLAVARRRPLPTRLALVPLLLASQLPDLVDKPLAYYGLVPYGRSLAHSVFAFVAVSVGLWLVSRRVRGRWADSDWRERLRRITPTAVAVGYASHLVGDAYGSVLAGEYLLARWLLYPLVVLPTSPADDVPPLVRLLRIYRSMHGHPNLEVILLAIAVFVGVRHWASGRRGRDSPTE